MRLSNPQDFVSFSLVYNEVYSHILLVHVDRVIFHNLLGITSTGFLRSVIYNSKQCRQASLPLYFVFLTCEEPTHRLEKLVRFCHAALL